MTGATPEEMIKYFGPRKKLFKIHFRNVSGPLPHFSETLIDDGYYDMSKIMQALVDVEFEGIVIPDHVPTVGGTPAAARDAALDRPADRHSTGLIQAWPTYLGPCTPCISRR